MHRPTFHPLRGFCEADASFRVAKIYLSFHISKHFPDFLPKNIQNLLVIGKLA